MHMCVAGHNAVGIKWKRMRQSYTHTSKGWQTCMRRFYVFGSRFRLPKKAEKVMAKTLLRHTIRPLRVCVLPTGYAPKAADNQAGSK